MATVRDFVAASLRELGVLAAGEVSSDDEATSGREVLNRMVNAWKAEQVFIYKNAATDCALVPGTQTYTVGDGGDFDVLRPMHLISITIRDASAATPYEMSLRMMTDQDWAEVRIKTQQAYRPQACYYNLTYPLATLVFWPIPTSATLTGVIYAPEGIDEFPSINTTISLPPGYERMIVKNLAVELAPSYEATVSPQLERQAQDSLAVVLRANKNLQEQRFDPGAMMRRRYYDIYSDLA
jgi:hypothetical protein